MADSDIYDSLSLELLSEQDEDYHESESADDPPTVAERWQVWSEAIDR